MATKTVLTRRELLRRGALGFGSLTLNGLSACEKHRVFACTSVEGLSADDILPRNRLAYADVAADPKKTCSTCQQFLPPPSGDRCGACKILKGPIHPDGTCKSYVARD